MSKKLPISRIEYADLAFNPVWGCKRICPFCYSRKFNNRFHIIPDFNNPQFFPQKLDQPANTKKPGVVVVGFQCDLFADWIEYEWIHKVLCACYYADRHTYLFLTKNPDRYRLIEISKPDNWYFGVTVTGFYNATHCPTKLIDWISFEPLLEDVDDEIEFSKFKNLKWVVIGGQTKPTLLPKKVWVEKIIKKADKHNIPVWMKNSIRPLYIEGLRQESPWMAKKI